MNSKNISLEKYIIKFIFKWEEHKPSTYKFEQKFLYKFNPKFVIYNKSYKTSQIKLNKFKKQNNYEAHKLHPTSKAPISYTNTKG